MVEASCSNFPTISLNEDKKEFHANTHQSIDRRVEHISKNLENG
jgi:hypothetical protein